MLHRRTFDNAEHETRQNNQAPCRNQELHLCLNQIDLFCTVLSSKLSLMAKHHSTHIVNL